MKTKKNAIRAIGLLLTLIMLVTTLSSCLMYRDNNDYMTKEEVEQMLAGYMGGGTTIENSPNYNITINNTGSANLVAAAKAVLSAVKVIAYVGNGYSTSTSNGAGVIYKLDKQAGTAYVITNYHVVYDAYANNGYHVSDNIVLRLYGQDSEKYNIPAKYIGGSMSLDIAVLKVEGSRVLVESNAMAVTVADSSKVAILDTAIAIGNPAAGGISATVGAVNVDSEYITMKTADGYSTVQHRLIRIDAAVNSGNSGGGLFNDKGELIGIVNAKNASTDIDNIGYAIPSNVAKNVTDNIIDHCDGKDDTWHPYRYLVGISLSAKELYTEYVYTENDKEAGKVLKREVVEIVSVEQNSPIRNEVKVGDVVKSVTIDGKTYEITRMYELIDVMYTARANSSVSILIESADDGTERTVVVPMASITPVAVS